MTLDLLVLPTGDLRPTQPDLLMRRVEAGMVVRGLIEVMDTPRSHPQNNLYWAFINWATKGGNIREEIENLIGKLTARAFHELLKSRQGIESTSFLGTGHDRFTAYFKDVQEREIEFFCGCSWDDAWPEIQKHMGRAA